MLVFLLSKHAVNIVLCPELVTTLKLAVVSSNLVRKNTFRSASIPEQYRD